jgi:uncharacterized alpha-E superfamily protein
MKMIKQESTMKRWELLNQLQKEIQQERVERQEEAQEMRQMCESIQKDMR